MSYQWEKIVETSANRIKLKKKDLWQKIKYLTFFNTLQCTYEIISWNNFIAMTAYYILILKLIRTEYCKCVL